MGGLAVRPGACCIIAARCGNRQKRGDEMRVVLSSYGSRGNVEPRAGLAARLRALGAEVRVCAPPDCAKLLAGVGVPLVPMGVWR